MRQVGDFEAKNKLASLLAEVERGTEIIITRRGRPVAKLVFAGEGFSTDKAQVAANNIRARAKRLKGGPFNWNEWKDFRDKGRAVG
jgi:antitoxin (DNA-binding transcriptional repressor) of toxin-antitoxin stability system